MIKQNIKGFNQIYFSLDDTKIIEKRTNYTKFEYKNNIYELNVEGDYNVQNSLAAIELGLLQGMTPKQIACGLSKYSPIEKRWDIENICGYKIIKTVLEGEYQNPVFVLGDMGELGENEIQYHKEIADFIIKSAKSPQDINVLTVGKLAKEITNELSKKNIFSKNFANNIDISTYILDKVAVGTTIVLKASRSMKFEEIIELIKQKGKDFV